jgi:Trk K+ transport system NAD-binding subunit
VSLASTPFRETIAARLAPLRDFLLLFFFIALGATLDLSLLGTQLGAALIFSAFVLIGNPLIVLAIMGGLGYRKRTGFLAGLTVAQISEFSLIFIAMGVAIGHVSPDALGLVTLVGLVTIAASTYMITWSHRLYAVFEPALSVFERRGTPREPDDGVPQGRHGYDVVIFGLGRFGTAIALRLAENGVRVLGVDFNPLAVRRWHKLGLDAEYGDATDPEFVAHLPLGSARWILSTVPLHSPDLNREDTRTTLIQIARSIGFGGKVAVASHSEAETAALRAAGADLVVEPFQDAADRAAELLTGGERKDAPSFPRLDSESLSA